MSRLVLFLSMIVMTQPSYAVTKLILNEISRPAQIIEASTTSEGSVTIRTRSIVGTGPIKTLKLPKLTDNVSQNIYHLAISPDGSNLAIGTNDDALNLVDLKQMTVRKRIDMPKAQLLQSAFSSNGKYLATSSVRGDLWIFDTSQDFTLVDVRKLVWNSSIFLRFLPDNTNLLVSGSFMVDSYNLTKLNQRNILFSLDNNQELSAIDFDDTFKSIYLAKRDRSEIERWDQKNTGWQKIWQAHGNSIRLQKVPRSHCLFSYEHIGGNSLILDTRTGKTLSSLRGGEQIHFTQSGEQVLVDSNLNVKLTSLPSACN